MCSQELDCHLLIAALEQLLIGIAMPMHDTIG